MQDIANKIHEIANNQFTKEKVDDFWRVIESVRWDGDQSVYEIRNNLMTMMSPTTASLYNKILTAYATALLKVHEHNIDNEITNAAAQLGAFNEVGLGKLNYDTVVNSESWYIELRDSDNSFENAIPDEDDYYFTSTVLDVY